MNELPTWIEKLLRAICPEDLFEQIEGDLIEIYRRDVRMVGQRKAKLMFIITALRFFRPGIVLRNRFSFNLTPPMFANYLKTTFRHVRKSKLNFIFKTGGLTLALLSFLVIAIYVSWQLSFDRFHADYENIYRVNSQWRENDEMARYALAPAGIGPAMGSEFPEVKSFARVGYASRYLIKYRDNVFHAEGIAPADTTVFDVLSFRFIQGDKRALNHPESIVLTQSLAKQIFGDEDPMGKSISFTDRRGASLHVTGVIEDLPRNSHLNIRALMPGTALKDSTEQESDPWAVGVDGSGLYIKLHEGVEAATLQAKATPVLRKKLTKNENGLEKEYAFCCSLSVISTWIHRSTRNGARREM